MRLLITITRAALASQSSLAHSFAAGVPLSEIKKNRFNPLYPNITKEMLEGITAWTYSKTPNTNILSPAQWVHGVSELAKRYLTGNLTDYEAELYRQVNKFALEASQYSLFQIKQSNLYRATQAEYLPVAIKNLLQTLPPIERMHKAIFSPYRTAEKPTILLDPVTSWTTLDLLDPEGILQLAKAYPSSLTQTNVVYVIRNARPRTGSALKHLSYIPEEYEVLLPQQTRLQVAHMGHFKRPQIENFRPGDRPPPPHALDQRPSSYCPSTAIHVIIVDAIEQAT